MKIRYRTERRWGKPPLIVLQVETTEDDYNSGSSFKCWRDAVPEDLFPQPEPLRGSTEAEARNLQYSPQCSCNRLRRPLGGHEKECALYLAPA